jgi:spore germination protein YaaH
LFIKIIRETELFLAINGTKDERRVIEGKIYEVVLEEKGFYKIRFGSRFGFIPKDYAEVMDIEAPQKIMIAWDYIVSKEDNKKHCDKYINQKCMEQGLDVVSPTWFLREGDTNKLESIRVVEKCDREYVRVAHSNGYEVWGLIADFNADRNYAVYTNQSLVDKEIDEIVRYALEYDLDGINIDFEGFGSRCKEAYNSYVEKLSRELRKHNIVVSIDVTRESDSDAWGKCYDRKQISKHVDYVCYMAYDENGRLDVVPGSTASLPWAEAGIIDFLDMGIQKEKIILGVPFYSRDWKVERVQEIVNSIVIIEWEGIAAHKEPNELSEKLQIKAGDVFTYQDDQNNFYKVTIDGKEAFIKKNICKFLEAGEEFYKAVEVLPVLMKEMETRKEIGTVKYDEYAEQQKLTYKDLEGNTHFIWLENADSMKKRIDLVKKYNLPGAAAWMLTQETKDIWTVIKELRTR